MARKTGFKGVLIFGSILAAGSIAVASFDADDQARGQSGALQREARLLDQEAETSRQAGAQAALEAQAAEEKARQDSEAAAKIGTSLAHYRWGAEHASVAAAICRSTIISRATSRSQQDWLPDYQWSVDPLLATHGHRSIYIIAQDVRLENGVGAMEHVKYSCVVALDPSGDRTSQRGKWWTDQGWQVHDIEVTAADY